MLDAQTTRRQTLGGILAGFGSAGLLPTLAACTTDPSKKDKAPGEATTGPLELDAERLEALYSELLKDTPWADRDVVGDFERGLEQLKEAGLEDTAAMFTHTANTFVGGGLSMASAMNTDDPDHADYLYAFKDGLMDTLAVQGDIAALAATAAEELKSLNGGGDTVSVATLVTPAEIFVEQETELRQFLYSEGKSGDPGQNLLLAGLANWRKDCTTAQSIASASDAVASTITALGVLDPSVTGLLPPVVRAEGPPPPGDAEAWQNACDALALVAIALAPFAAGGAIGAAEMTGEELIETAIEHFLGSGSTIAEKLAGGLDEDGCSTLLVVIQLVAQAVAFAMAMVAIMVLVSALTGPMGILWMMFLLFQLVMAILGAVCTLAGAIKLSIDYAECGT